jgi:hypothetical protein
MTSKSVVAKRKFVFELVFIQERASFGSLLFLGI